MKHMRMLKTSLFLGSVVFYTCVVQCHIKILFPAARPLSSEILKLISEEKKSIIFAEFALHHPDVVSALILKAKSGVTISGVVDQNSVEQIGKHILLKDKHAQNSIQLLKFLRNYDVDVFASFGRSMHNKIMCFAHNSETNGPIVVTGSANCTVSGLDGTMNNNSKVKNSYNFENLLVIEGHKKIYNQCVQEITRIKEEAKRQRDKRNSKS